MPTPSKVIERPAFVQDYHLDYLDELRDSGETNMFGASPYLLHEYPELTVNECDQVVSYWMKTFSDRHPDVKNGQKVG